MFHAVRKRSCLIPILSPSTTYAMRAQLSRLRADCEVSCVKCSSERMAAALKSCAMSGAVIGESITVTQGRGWEEASEVPVPVTVFFVDGWCCSF